MIQIGDPIPAATLQTRTAEGVQNRSTAELFAGKRAVLFGLPGAFTPACSDAHLPGFLRHADAIRDRGIDLIACMAVNDPFVMAAWADAHGVGERVLMLADGNGELTRALGLELDLSAFGMGRRCRRFAAVLDDGVVTSLGVEDGPEVGVSSAEAVLETL